MPFAPLPRANVAARLAARIRERILGGALTPGVALPAERELASQFGVNRSSVREALRQLEASGLVQTRHGGGTRVADFLAAAGLQLLPFLLAPGGRVDRKMLAELLEVRTELLCFTAALAAERRTPAQADLLDAACARLVAAQSAAEAQLADWALYEALTAATGNRVLSLVCRASGQVYVEHARHFAGLYRRRPVPAAPLRALSVALQKQRPMAARRAMAAHVAHQLAEEA